MKKLILSLGMMGLGFGAMSQVIFSVEEPASIQGFYDFEVATTGWGLSSLAGIYVLDTVKIYDDGVSTGVNAQGNPVSANACNAAPAGSLAGKIALVFRGDGTTNANNGACEFGLKAYNAQQAGAVAVIIVNREEQVAGMAAGANGAMVTIPVVMVGLSTGQAIMNTINNSEDVIAFIGDKTGYYADDISIFDNGALRANFGVMPEALAQSAAELSVPIGGWVYNYGQNNQTGITLQTTINNGSNVYDQTSAAFDLNSGDSLYVTMPTFSMASYAAGQYDVTYTLNMPATDLFVGDNVSTSTFNISDSLWSWARMEGNTIAADGFYRGNPAPADYFTSCGVFTNPNASRLNTDGLYYGGVTISAADSAIISTVEGVELNAFIYEWNDAFTSTADAAFANLNEVASGSYYYTSDAQEEQVFIPFDNAYTFTDDQLYLACVTSYIPQLFHGMDTKSIYDQNQVQVDYPRFPIDLDGTYNALGFGIAGSMALHVGEGLSVAENNVEVSAFPNPSKDVITVKVNASGDATLNITDMAGRVVSTQTVKLVGGQFTTNVAGMNAGTYVFALDFANGTTSRFNVVVTK